jgi:hypothetical protein
MIRNVMQQGATQLAGPRRRRGILSMELVLTLPVLMILLFGIFEFTCLFYTYGSVVEASRAGARRATLHGVFEEDVHEVIHRSLGTRLYQVSEVAVDGSQSSGEPVICAVRVPMSACAPNLLWPIGFDLEGRSLECATHMVKE